MHYEELIWCGMYIYAAFAVLVIVALRNSDQIISAIKRAYAKYIDRRQEAAEKVKTFSFRAIPQEKTEIHTTPVATKVPVWSAPTKTPKKTPAPAKAPAPAPAKSTINKSYSKPSVESIPLPPTPRKATDSEKQRIADELFAFKMALLRNFPFYGDLVMKLQVIEDETVPTACTNGLNIRYNPNFFVTMTTPEYCYVLMHEVMHALLRHPTRVGNRDPELWNVACDFVVNDMLNKLRNTYRYKNIEIKQPAHALILPSHVVSQNSVETLYSELYNQQKAKDKSKDHFEFTYKRFGSAETTLVAKLPGDMIFPTGLSDSEKKEIENAIETLLKEAGGKYAGTGNMDCWIPDELIVRKESRKIPWKRLLRDYLEEGEYDEYSYFTPERKYIHMNLILPGPGERSSELGEIWAFIDDSGSITPNQMGEFLTQLYRILKEFSGTMHVAFWNTRVDAVYRNIQNYKEIDNIKPKGSGGTDINCVYKFMQEEKIKPEIMLILTDGYYGDIQEGYVKKTLKKNTIVVLTEDGDRNTEIAKKIGKVASL